MSYFVEHLRLKFASKVKKHTTVFRLGKEKMDPSPSRWKSKNYSQTILLILLIVATFYRCVLLLQEKC